MTNLRFERFIIENFKSFMGKHEFLLNRPSGLYYITGNNLVNPELGANGVGKSASWDALFWAAYGKTIRDNKPASAVVPWDLKKGTTQVQLEFSRGRKKHTLIRSRNPNELTLDGTTVTQAEINTALGMSEEMFRRTVVLGQFGSLFLDLRPEEQARMFNEALNLDLWLKASANASQRQKALFGQLVGTKVELSKLDGRQTELKAQLVREIEAKDSFATSLAEQRTKLKRRLSTKQSALESFIAENPVPDSASRPVAGKNGKPAIAPRETALASLEASWAKFGRELRDLEVEAGAVVSDIKMSQGELKQYTNAINGNKACPACGQVAPLAHLKSKTKLCENAIAEKQALHTNMVKLLKTRSDAVAEAERIIKEQRKLIRAQETLQSEVDLARRELSRFGEQENPHEATIKDLNKRLRSLELEQGKLRERQAQLEYDTGVCEYWVGAFKEIRLSLIDAALLELEMAVTRHVEALGLPGWQVKFATERVKASGDVSTVFTVLLHPPDQDEAIKFESYSGGESQRLQLAVAFGLSEVILVRAGVSPNIQVLDEPTRGLSPEGVEDLLTHLAQRSEDLGICTFVTEHHSLERGMFKRMITIEKDVNGSHILED